MQDEEYIKSLRNYRIGLVVFLSEMVEKIEERLCIVQTRYGSVEMSALSDSIRHAARSKVSKRPLRI